MNALLAAARGDYFLFAFHDDLLAPRYVERCVAALEANPRAIVAFSDLTLVHEDGRTEAAPVSAARRRDAAHATAPAASCGSRDRGGSPTAVCSAPRRRRRSAGSSATSAGEFSADWPWLLHMSLLGEFVRVPECLVTKVYTPQSLSRQWRLGAWPSSAVALSALREVVRARLPAGEKLALANLLAQFAWRRIRHGIGRRVVRSRRAPRPAGADSRRPAQPDHRPSAALTPAPRLARPTARRGRRPGGVRGGRGCGGRPPAR